MTLECAWVKLRKTGRLLGYVFVHQGRPKGYIVDMFNAINEGQHYEPRELRIVREAIRV